MTLNDLERRNSPYFAFFFHGIRLHCWSIRHNGWRYTYNVRKYCHPFAVFPFWRWLTHPTARSLCDSWATCKARQNCNAGFRQARKRAALWTNAISTTGDVHRCALIRTTATTVPVVMVIGWNQSTTTAQVSLYVRLAWFTSNRCNVALYSASVLPHCFVAKFHCYWYSNIEIILSQKP